MVASTITLTPVPAPISSLSIAGRAGHAFTPHAMMEGFACHARGVELPSSGPARVHARVRSKRVHDVHLRAERGQLVVACSCPARSLGLDVCKHVWAALLEVDRHNALGDLRTARGPLVVEPSALPPAGPPGAEDPASRAVDVKSARDAEARPTPKPVKHKAAQPRSKEAPPPRAKTLARTSGLRKKTQPSEKPAAAAAEDAPTMNKPAKRETKKDAPRATGRTRAPAKSSGTSKRQR